MKEFLLTNWKWIIGIIIALLGLIISVIELARKKKPVNSQKSGKNSINVQSNKNIKIGKDD